MTSKLQRVFRCSIAFAMLSVSFSLIVWMNDGEMGGMSACPAMEQGALCAMTVSEHIDAWQKLFGAVAPGLFLIIILALAVHAWWMRSNAVQEVDRIYLVRHRLRYRAFFQKLFDDILQALASGIIHPKQYEYGVA